jgi:hypothetical protein
LRCWMFWPSFPLSLTPCGASCYYILVLRLNSCPEPGMASPSTSAARAHVRRSPP